MHISIQEILNNHILEFLDLVVIGETCWFWRGPRTGGRYKTTKGWKSKNKYGWFMGHPAHVIMWSFYNKKLPDKHLERLHKCNNWWCVRPTHIEQNTHSENMRDIPLKQLCGRGHLLNQVGFYMHNGKRQCKACTSIWSAGYYQRRKKALANEATR